MTTATQNQTAEATMNKFYICTEAAVVDGFQCKEGFAVLLDPTTEKVLAITSGWNHDEERIFVYRPTPDGWFDAGKWEDEETFPITEVLNAMDDYHEDKEIAAAIEYGRGKKLHVSDEKLKFWNTMPGERCNNGGEYGFYTVYSPIPGYPGIYKVREETTCDFDACGTGPRGIKALTAQEYRRLRHASDKVEADGSLY